MNPKTMVTIGIIVIVAGASLAIVQMAWKVEATMRGWDGSLVTLGHDTNKLDPSYLYIGIGSAIVGALFIVGGSIMGQQKGGS